MSAQPLPIAPSRRGSSPGEDLAVVRAALVLPAGRGPEVAAVLAGDPRRWLPATARRAGASWLLRVHAGRLVREVRARVGDAVVDPSCGAVRRSLGWTPISGPDRDADRMVPAFEGELSARPDGGLCLLVLEGRYRPPGGVLGRGVDALLLHHVADRSIGRLLDQLHDRLLTPVDQS